METKENGRENLGREVEALRAELREREKALPAHSIRPHQLLAIEELKRAHELTGGDPVIADFSSAAVSMGKVNRMIRRGELLYRLVQGIGDCLE